MALLLLNPYVDVILALALAFIGIKIIQALFGPLFGLPVVGGAIEGAVHKMNQSVSNAAGHVVSGADHAVGTSLHTIARFIDRTLGTFKNQAKALFLASVVVQALAVAFHAVRALVHRAEHIGHGLNAAVRTLTKEYHGIEHRVKVLERDVSKGIGADVLPRIKTLEREVDHVEGSVIPAIQHAEADAAQSISNLYDWIKSKANIAGVGTFAFAVATIIGADVLKLFKCPTFLNKTLGRGCGLWNGLEDLFGLFIDGLFFLDLCQVVPLVEGVFAEFEAPIVDLISAGANAACAHPPSGWVTLPAPTLRVPTAGEITATL